MKQFCKLFAHSIGIAFIIFLYSQGSNTKPSLAKISCDQTLSVDQLTTSFECGSTNKIVTTKSSPEDIQLTVSYDNDQRPQEETITENVQEIQIPKDVSQVEIVIQP